MQSVGRKLSGGGEAQRRAVCVPVIQPQGWTASLTSRGLGVTGGVATGLSASECLTAV